MDKLQNIDIIRLYESPLNPRKRFNEEAMAELTASIAAQGILQPILVRPDNTGKFEIAAGARRYRAAVAAGLGQIPAVIRELTDDQLLEAAVIENLQRDNLHPLEEAEGYEAMMKHGYTADTLAEKIGKSRSYIFGRLKLLDLDEDGRRLFYAGALNPSTALLVARIPSHKLQAKAIEDLTKTDFYGETKSVREAQRWIRDRYMLDLAKAPFPTEDGELIATAGPCSACPKRTGNSPDLFDDIDNANVCTDPDCHTAKKIAAAERRAREAGPDVKIVTGEEAEKILPSYSCESRTHVKLDSTCYDDPKHRTYREIIGDDQSAITLVEHAHKGELVPVVAKKVVTEKLKAQGVVTRAQETREENKKIKAQVALANDFRDRLFRKVREAAPDKFFGQVLNAALPIIARRFLIDAGNSRGEQTAALWGAIGHNSWDRLEAFRNGLGNFKTHELLFICLDLALLAEHKTDEHNLKREPEGLLAMAGALEIDADALLKAAKEAQKPAPKAKKSTKKGPAGTSEDHSYPSEAAQAQDLTREETPGGATEAAPAADETPLEDQTPAPADAEAEKQSSGSIEPNEKPTGNQPAFAVGDRVIVTGPEAEEDGLSGKSGVVIATGQYPSGIRFYGVKLDSKEGEVEYEDLDFQEDELRFSGIDADEKPSGTTCRFVIGDHVRVTDVAHGENGFKSTLIGLEGTIDCIYYANAGEYEVLFENIGLMILRDEQLELVEKSVIESDEKPSKRTGPSVQYRHPEEPSLEWTGRGRKPRWVEFFLASGRTLEDLKIVEATA